MFENPDQREGQKGFQHDFTMKLNFGFCDSPQNTAKKFVGIFFEPWWFYNGIVKDVDQYILSAKNINIDDTKENERKYM